LADLNVLAHIFMLIIYSKQKTGRQCPVTNKKNQLWTNKQTVSIQNHRVV